MTLPLLLICALFAVRGKVTRSSLLFRYHAMAAPPCPLLGDGVTDDTLLHIARFLPDPRDLLCLQLTNKRFGAKVIAAPSSGEGGWGDQAAAAPEMLSLAAEAARRWVAGCSEQERGWVPRREIESCMAGPDARGGVASAAADSLR